MKFAILFTLLAGFGSLSQTQQTHSISGKWRVHTRIIQESDFTCSFAQEGMELKGTCSGEHRKFGVTGKVEGNKASWSYKTEYNGEVITLRYEGNIDSESKITGSAQVTTMGLEGDFTAIKDSEAANLELQGGL